MGHFWRASITAHTTKPFMKHGSLPLEKDSQLFWMHYSNALLWTKFVPQSSGFLFFCKFCYCVLLFLHTESVTTLSHWRHCYLVVSKELLFEACLINMCCKILHFFGLPMMAYKSYKSQIHLPILHKRTTCVQLCFNRTQSCSRYFIHCSLLLLVIIILLCIRLGLK